MKFDPRKHNRRSIRLRGYDYTRAGAYFVTICAQNRRCLFGDIVGGEMALNDAGRIAEQCWNAIVTHFPHVELDTFVIMPNHIHGIIVITDAVVVGAKNFSPLRSPTAQSRGTTKTIGSIIRGFKIGVTKWMRQNTTVHTVWQRGFYEHIVRNENELRQIREYIVNNPEKWDSDRNNPDQFTNNTVAEPQPGYGIEPWMV